KVATRSALLGQGCEPAVATVRGDFLLVLYGWPAELTSKEGTTHLPSGGRSLAPQPALDSSGAAGAVDEQYLYVSNGTLRLPLAPTARLYLGHAHLHSEGRVEIRDADGTLSGAAGTSSLNARSLVLAGTLEATLAGSGTRSPLLTQWAGTADLEADGSPLPLGATPVAGSGWPWPWLLGAVGLASFPFLASQLRRSRGAAARAHRVDDLVFRGAELAASGQLEAARRLTAKAVHLDPGNPEVHFIHAGTLRRLHDYRTALHHHFQAAELLGQDADPDLVAENAFQIALALARQPGASASEVVKWLRHATQANPDLWEDVVGHDELEPYLPDLERRARPLPPPDFDAAFA
ncbi:MAG TPA: hypothetical protein VHI93_06985, partial [Candidatus Thermoplasmatota archaeon]|nr:hypothetical protein [Candidatus Thermoplasmatota archaeon]